MSLGCDSDVEALSAAALTLCIGITKYEFCLDFIVDVVHLCANQEHESFGVDYDPHAPLFY